MTDRLQAGCFPEVSMTDPINEPGPSSVAVASPEDSPEETPLVEADLLVEDVSIDGMCGVY
jgi:mycofactocin precursor